jgi:hypothetical protein
MITKGNLIYNGILVLTIIATLIITSTICMSFVQGKIHFFIQQRT